MFESRTKHHRRRTAGTQRARLGRGLSRRLGVEAMEGRLMLAATALEFTPVELPVAQVATDTTQQSTSTLAPSVWVTRLNAEGGFITSQFSFSDARNFDTAVLFGNAISSDALDKLILDNHVGTAGAQGTTRGWVLVNDFDVQSAGIQPVVVVVAGSNADVTLALEPILNQFNSAHTGSGEGGSIPISAILTSPELERGPDAGRPIRLASLAAGISGEPVPTANLAAVRPADAGISGEWARAMVFELAGGEPDRDGRAPVHDDVDQNSSHVDAALQDGVPLSSVPTRRAAEQAAAQNSNTPQFLDLAAKVPSAALPEAESSAWASPLLSAFNSMAGDGKAADGETSSSPPAVNSHSAGSGAGQTAGAAVLPASVFEKAFEQIGRSANSVIQSLAADSWRRSLGAAPLLMVLALERIAVGNSRRVNRDAANIATYRPRQPRLSSGGLTNREE